MGTHCNHKQERKHKDVEVKEENRSDQRQIWGNIQNIMHLSTLLPIEDIHDRSNHSDMETSNQMKVATTSTGKWQMKMPIRRKKKEKSQNKQIQCQEYAGKA